MAYIPWCPGPDTEAAWIKALREFGENFSFPMQNFSSVSAGRNRDDLEERVVIDRNYVATHDRNYGATV